MKAFIVITLVTYVVAKSQGYDTEISGYGVSNTPSLSAVEYQLNSGPYPKSSSSLPSYSTVAPLAYQPIAGQNQLSYLVPSYKSAPLFVQQSGFKSGYQPVAQFSYLSNIPLSYQSGARSGYQPAVVVNQPSAAPSSYLKNPQSGYQPNVTPVPSYKQNSKLNYQSTLSPYSFKSSASNALLNPSFTSPQYQSQNLQQSGQQNLQKAISKNDLLKSSSDSSDLYKPAENGFNAFAPGNIAGPEEVTPILSQSSQQNLGDGSYSYSYETGNGISASEYGQLKPGGPEGTQSVYGSYSYPGEDGKIITVTYTADENGFVAKGDHLPTPPPIPAEILQSLQQNAAEEAAQQQSSYGQNGGSATYSQESEVYNQGSNTGSYSQPSVSGSYNQASNARSYGQTSNLNALRQNPSFGTYN